MYRSYDQRVKKSRSAKKQAFWCHIISSFLIHCLMSVFQNMCQNSDIQIAITFDSLDFDEINTKTF